jgi:uncharacterized protein (TIGR03546 family)
MIKAIAKLIVALNGNVKKSQVAAGFAWGLLLGIVPAGSFIWIVILLVTFFFRHNHGAMLLGMVVFKLLSPLAASPIDSLGWGILHMDSLQPLFTTMYNMPFVPFTKFNNTLVAGGLVSGIVLWLPAFLLFMALVPLYRNTLAPKIRNSKIVQKIAKFPLIGAISSAVSKAGGI